MKRIPLTKGMFALVDDDMFDELNAYHWQASRNRDGGVWYAGRGAYLGIKHRTIFMHDQIMNPPAGLIVDHRNQQGLDNRRENLRICTHSQNLQNMRIPKSNKSGFKGVSWHVVGHKWQACIRVNGKTLYLGLFADLIEAAHAHDRAAREHFGQFARLNFPQEVRE